MSNKEKIIFFGTSVFAVPALKALKKGGFNIVAVITNPDEMASRKQVFTSPPVKIAAEKLGLRMLQPIKLKNDSALTSALLSLHPDLGVMVSYGKIIPEEIINIFPKRLLNIHPSLLPKYRGPSPIQYTLLNGDRETGVTIIKVDETVDHGPIVAQSAKRQVQSDEKYKELHDELSELGAELLIKVLPSYLKGKIISVEQNHDAATHTKMIKKEDGRIDWHKTADHIFNMYRAFHVWPGIFTNEKRKMKNEKEQGARILKIAQCQVSKKQSNHGHEEKYIGKVYQEGNSIYVPTSKGYLQLLRVQLESGKEMPIKEFLTGHKDFIGSKLG